MKNCLTLIFIMILFFCIIYGFVFMMSYGYYHWNAYLSFFIDLLYILVVIYVIEILVKKIDKRTTHDE